MSCNVRDVVTRNPQLLDGPMKSFFQNPTFECSNSLVASLPFDFVKKLRIGKDAHLPSHWRVAVKKDAQHSSSGNIKSIQLWRHCQLLAENGKVTTDRIYLAEYDVLNNDRRCITHHAFVKEIITTYSLRREPWTIANVRPLCLVRSYRKVIFG
jgi:hypothetical protein